MQIGKMESKGKSTPLTPLTPAPDAAVFASAHAALKFAFNFSHGTLKRGTIGALAGGGGNGRGLGGLDGAAQAGMILLELDALSKVGRNIVAARFAPQAEPCGCRSRCCRGYAESQAFVDAVETLTEVILLEGLTGTISHYRLRRAVVLRYFGVRMSFPEIAAACRVNRDTACDLNKRVVERLKAEEARAMAAIEDRLRRAGIVGEVHPA